MGSPSNARRSLARQLKALREASGKTVADVALTPITSRAKLFRIEAGETPVKWVDVKALCDLYGADPATTDQLTALSLLTTEQGWWEPYGDAMARWFATYVDLESAASLLLTWDPELIHGLLQTPAYQRAVFETFPDMTAEYSDRQVQLRSQRQRAAFDRSPPVRVTAIIGEGALRRKVGGRKVMVDQFDHLLALSAGEHIDVLYLPFDVGAHAAMKGAFTILDQPDDLADVVDLETHAGGRYLEQDKIVGEYRHRFEMIRAQSAPLKEYEP